MKKQALYLLTGILLCLLSISKIVNMSEYLFFPGIKKISEEQMVQTIAVVEDGLTMEMILQAQENDEQFMEEVEETLPVHQVELNMEKLKDYNYLRSTFYTVDSSTTIGEEQLNIEDLLKYDTKIDNTSNGPKVLIFHTHSQEAFADSTKGDANTSIVGMGAYLSELLNMKGIETIMAIDPDARFIDYGLSFAQTVQNFAERGKRCFCYTADASDENVKAIRDYGCLLALISLNANNFEAAICQKPDMCEFLHTSDFKAIENDYMKKVKLY